MSLNFTRSPFIRFTGVGLEAVVSWLPFPVKSNKRLVCHIMATDWGRCFIAYLNYLEQSFPIQPGLQWHLFGRMQRPLLRQGEEHTAAGSKEEAADIGGAKTTLGLTGRHRRAHRCGNACLSIRRDTRTGKAPHTGPRSSTAGCRWLRRRRSGFNMFGLAVC